MKPVVAPQVLYEALACTIIVALVVVTIECCPLGEFAAAATDKYQKAVTGNKLDEDLKFKAMAAEDKRNRKDQQQPRPAAARVGSRQGQQ